MATSYLIFFTSLVAVTAFVPGPTTGLGGGVGSSSSTRSERAWRHSWHGATAAAPTSAAAPTLRQEGRRGGGLGMSAGGTNTVVVTGLGVVSGVGTGVEAFWEGLLKGESSINRVEGFDPERFKCQIGSEAAVSTAVDLQLM
ncbi:unnamed protein product [Ectocarpus sp. CCAP 1310/34]|nr:unnamed protein product [Ectocarpus sp. CCAP 1310/34]